MIPLERPTRIGPHQVVLVDDLVLTHLTEPLAERLMAIASDDPELPLYVEQEQVDALSELHPGLPLYGLWQVLIASGLIPEQPGLYQVAADSPPHEGRYLLREAGNACSGRMTGETLLDAFALADTAPAPIWIDPAPETLRLPSQPIQTLRYRRARKTRARLRALTLAGVMVLGCLFAGTAADHILGHRHAQKVQQAERLREQTSQLQQDLARLEAGGRIEPIDQSRRLDQLLILSWDFRPVELPQASVLAAETLTAIVHPLDALPPTLRPGFRSGRPRISPMVRFTLSGSRWQRQGLPALFGLLCLGLTGLAVTVLDQKRVTPDLAGISEQYARLAQSRQQLEDLPPVRPIHWHLRQLRQLARALPGVHEVKAIEADPDLYPEAVRQRIGSFGGTVWKVALRGAFPAVIWLCRAAQPRMPLIVDEVRAAGRDRACRAVRARREPRRRERNMRATLLLAALSAPVLADGGPSEDISRRVLEEAETHVHELRRLHATDALLEVQLRIAKNSRNAARPATLPGGGTDPAFARGGRPPRPGPARQPAPARQRLPGRAQLRLDNGQHVEVRAGQQFGSWRIRSIGIDLLEVQDPEGRRVRIPLEEPAP